MLKTAARWMAAGVLWGVLIGMPGKAGAAVLSIPSPSENDTWQWGSLREWTFQTNHKTGTLVLVLTYTNVNLADKIEPVENDDLYFDFPEVHGQGASFVFRGGKEKPIIVAWRGTGFSKAVRLQPNVTALVERFGTQVRVSLGVFPAGQKVVSPLREVNHSAPF